MSSRKWLLRFFCLRELALNSLADRLMGRLKQPNLSTRFAGLRPASENASRLAAKSSRKRGTACEVKLWSSVRKHGLKFRKNVSSLPGCPDLVFGRERVVIFVDGDFWHGRRLTDRIAKLSKGHNSEYWIHKIRSNVARDKRVRRKLRALGWHVIRVWEGQVNSDVDRVTSRIVNVLRAFARLP